MGFLNLQESFLRVESRVGSESSGDDKEGIGEDIDTILNLSGDCSFELIEVLSSGNLEGSSSGNNSFVLNSVDNGSKSISDGVLSLGDRVVVGTLDEDGTREWVLNSLNESVFVLSESVLVDVLGETEILLGHTLERVDGVTTTGESESLHVSSLGSSESDDSFLGEDIKRDWVDTLLVDDDKVLVSSLTDLSLKSNKLGDLLVSVLSLGVDELFSLLGGSPEESRVSLSLLVLEGDVHGEDETVLKLLGHVRVSGSVIENKTSNELGLSGEFVSHVHDFDHVEIDIFFLLNSENGVSNDVSELLSHLRVELGHEGGSSDLDESGSVHILLDSEVVEELKSFVLGHLDTVDNDSGMDSLLEVSLGSLHQLS